MNRILMAALAATFAAGPVMAQTTMNFNLGLAAYDASYAQAWKDQLLFGYPTFTPGSTADGQTFASTAGLTIVTWDVAVEVAGTLADSSAPSGASNVVFSLELYDSNDVLVAVGRADGNWDADPFVPRAPSGPGFYSAINDGGMDSLGAIQDITTNAAFACSFDGLVAGVDGPARLVDDRLSEGPGMERAEYPSAAGFPAATTAAQGTLVGMGAGYSEFGANQIGGIGNIGTCAVGVVSVAEGQIALADGVYTLKVVPGTGNNVLNTCSAVAGGFAVAVDSAVGSELTFTVGEGGVDPVLVSAASVRTHGAAGDLGIDLPIDGTVVNDPRTNGAATVVLTYDADPTALAGSVAVTGGSLDGVTVDGNDLVVALTTLKNACVTVTDGAATVAMTTQVGNVTGDTIVNLSDLLSVKGKLFATVDATTMLQDVTADGIINLSDLLATKGNLFQAASCD